MAMTTTFSEFSATAITDTRSSTKGISDVGERAVGRWVRTHIPFGDVSVPERRYLPKGSVAPLY